MSEEIVAYVTPGHPWGSVNMSPFCSKLETYLRMADIPYRTAAADPRRAPKGKVPYVDLGGRLMGDSQLVIEKLESERPPLRADLSVEQRATGHALRRMLEEGLYFVSLHLRWVDDEGFRLVRTAFNEFLPALLRPMMPLIRRKMRKVALGQGTSRHTDEEVYAMGIADLEAVSELLAAQPFLFGERPSTFDATAFAFVDLFAAFPRESPVRTFVRGRTNLMDYRRRIRQRWWPQLAVD